MLEENLLTLEQAAARSGHDRRALRALVRSGRLPAIRREGRWLIAPADLDGLAGSGARGGQATPAALAVAPLASTDGAAEGAGRAGCDELLALLDLVRERDAQITMLQEERVHLAGLVGFLQAQLLERETQVRRLEARPVVPAIEERAQSAAEIPPAADEPGTAGLPSRRPWLAVLRLLGLRH